MAACGAFYSVLYSSVNLPIKEALEKLPSLQGRKMNLLPKRSHNAFSWIQEFGGYQLF
jgi:hypothetical protein